MKLNKEEVELLKPVLAEAIRFELYERFRDNDKLKTLDAIYKRMLNL